MAAIQTLSGLSAFSGRGAGTDAERRAATWLSGELALGDRQIRIETFWCRPNWALAHAWHVLLGLAGSLVSVGSPRVGGALILVALLSLLADVTFGWSLGRRLTAERASQNVILAAPPTPAAPDASEDPPTGYERPPVRLILTAQLDAGRMGIVFRPALRNLAARARARTGGLLPGWMGWLAIVLICLEAIAVARLGGSRGTAVGVAQLIPTAVLVLALALLLEHASSDFGPAAGDNASGVAAAVAIARALVAGPPAHANVELVLQGAGDGGAIGLRRYLRARRRELKPATAVVLGLSPCSSGAPRWWISEGQLVPRRYFAALRSLAARVAADNPRLDARPIRSRGGSPALPAVGRLPALAIGLLDGDGLAPRSHTSADTVDLVDPTNLDRAVEFGLLVIDALDAHLGRLGVATPA